MPPSIGGVLDLRDLSAFPWSARRVSVSVSGFVSGAGSRFRATLPPSRLVVVADALGPESLTEVGAWLAEAGALWLLLDPGDAEVDALQADKWREVSSWLGNVIHMARLEPVQLQVALDWARDIAAPWPAEPPPLEPRHWPAGPWIPVVGRAALEPRVVLTAQGPALLPDEAERHLLTEPAGAPLQLVLQGVNLDRIVTRSGPVPVPSDLRQRWGMPFGFDASRPLAAAGYRSRFTWLFGGRRGLSKLCDSVHDWPCGQARKLYGYSNNHPVALAVAPDASAVVSTFDHDVLLCSEVPLAWRDHDGLAVADWPGDPTSDPLRAVLFQAQTGDDAWPADPADPEDEDARWRAPVVVLGPSDHARYAVDLSEETWRIRPGGTVRLSAAGGGWAIYDAGHVEVARHSGRLMGGAFRWATVLEGEQLVRVDLQTGARTILGSAERDLIGAVSVPGAANVVLVAEGAVRLL